MPKGVKTTDEQIQKIKEMTEGGYTQFDIGDRVGLCKDTVKNIQQKLGLRASNRWKFGESAEIPEVERYREQRVMPVLVPDKVQSQVVEHHEWVTLTYKSIRLHGMKTDFDYEIGLQDTSLRIRPGYSEELEIDLKDLVSFGNELLDVADRIMEMKKNLYI